MPTPLPPGACNPFQDFGQPTSSLNQQKVLPPVHCLVLESKVEVSGGVGQVLLEYFLQQVVSAVQAGHRPLLDVTPVLSF